MNKEGDKIIHLEHEIKDKERDNNHDHLNIFQIKKFNMIIYFTSHFKLIIFIVGNNIL